MLSAAYYRYKKPIFVSETGHFGVGRAEWMEEIVTECLAVENAGIPFFGICIYPIIDRPDWDNLKDYHNSGIFDLDEFGNRIPERNVIEKILSHQNLRQSLTEKSQVNWLKIDLL